ncbi:hypothetical protein BG015_012098 [Linnemannia schmuckeri]|uniref:Uncharacterized protein n=1 Tax=Linnemannia schmuckeri TaxID=64567 RepID=A0A9P5RS49_9FUNG|nr:hypothetical protein BG015_012098 [Linnemannia schmuckeri]
MKFNSTLSFLFTLFTLLSACLVVHAAPAPPASKLFRIENPEEGDVFLPSYDIYVHTETDDGANSYIFKKNPDVLVTIQTNIPKPDLNVDIITVPYRTLHGHGIFFKAKKEWFRPDKPNTRFRIRASFKVDGKHGYVDSSSFYLKLNEDN